MGMDEYLNTVLEQIRCRSARQTVETELRRHMEDQAEACEARGMSREEAVREAVRQMGDPVEAGVALDRIHRPKTDWKTLALILFLSAAGLVLQALFAFVGGDWTSFFKTAFFTALGLALMGTVYRLDYSILGRNPMLFWLGGFLFLLLLAAGTENESGRFLGGLFIQRINGQLPIYNLLLLFIPLYAGILYRFRNGGYRELFACLAWLICPIFLCLKAVQSTALAELGICFLAMTFVSVWKGWFRIKRGRTLAVMGGGALGFPWLFYEIGLRIGILRDYQAARIQAFLHMEEFQDGVNYARAEVLRVVDECTFLGNGTLPAESSLVACTLDSEYAVTALFYYYGILAGSLVLLLLTFLFVRAGAVCMHQKNRLGMMAGLGCVLALGIQAVTYVLSNFGIGLLTQKTMPFLASGGQGILTNYILLGLLLSIYRYKDILPAETAQREPVLRHRLAITKKRIS